MIFIVKTFVSSLLLYMEMVKQQWCKIILIFIFLCTRSSLLGMLFLLQKTGATL